MRGAVAIRAAAFLIGAGCVVWATVPQVHKGLADWALFLAIVGVAAGALRLALTAVPVPEASYLLPAGLRVWLSCLETLRKVSWEEGALIAILWLEVLHPSRPWHTAVLGAALIAYLLATHLAESAASLSALRPQIRVLAVGVGLLALGAAAGMLPEAGPGPARRCCGWWLRARSSPRPASPCRMSRDTRGPPITEGAPCRDIQEGHRIPRSSWGPGAYDEPGQGGKMGLYADSQEGRTRWLRSSGPGLSSSAGPGTRIR